MRSAEDRRRRVDADRDAVVAGLVGERNAQPSQQPAEINRIPAQLAPVEEVPNALDDGPRAAGFLLDIFDRLPQQLGVDRVLRQEPRARMSKRCRRRQRLAEPCTTATPNAPTVVSLACRASSACWPRRSCSAV